MDINRTTQTGNRADDIAGRDIHKKIYNFESIKVNHEKLKTLFDKIEEERKSNVTLNQFIEELERYTKPRTGTVKGLKEKFEESSRLNFLDYAMEAKETYSKFLLKNQFLKSAQEVNVYLLALVRSYYNNQIYPVILEGADQSVIGNLLVEKIVEPMLSHLKEDTLGFNAEHIDGMIYYLTGHCFLEWK